MELVDTHAHLFSLHVPVNEVLKRAYEAGVTRIICIGSAEGLQSAHEAIKFTNYTGNSNLDTLTTNLPTIWATVGIHPHSAGDYQSVLELEHLLENKSVVAVGETGLDFFRDWAPFDKQEELFKNSVSLALNKNLPLVIHSRDAKEKTLSILKDMKAYKVGGVFHCYAYDAEFAKKLLDINFKISFTGALSFANATNLRQAAKEIKLSQIMLETDCPYMAPVPFRGKPSEPMHVLEIAKTISNIKDISLDEVATVTTNNALQLFKIL